MTFIEQRNTGFINFFQKGSIQPLNLKSVSFNFSAIQSSNRLINSALISSRYDPAFPLRQNLKNQIKIVNIFHCHVKSDIKIYL